MEYTMEEVMQNYTLQDMEENEFRRGMYEFLRDQKDEIAKRGKPDCDCEACQGGYPIDNYEIEAFVNKFKGLR